MVCDLLHVKHTVSSKSLDRASRAICARVGDTHDGDQNNGVEDRRQNLDAGELDGNDER